MSDQHEFIKRLANNMLLVPIRVGRLSLEVKTKKGAEAVTPAPRAAADRLDAGRWERARGSALLLVGRARRATHQMVTTRPIA